MILGSLDGLVQDFVLNITVQRSREMVRMTTEEVLPSKSLWNATILPYGCGAGVGDTIELS